jgi:hypothetical protein
VSSKISEKCDNIRQDLYQKIIENYIDAYNSFDVNRMLSDMHDDVKFENISNGEVNLVTNEGMELRNQAKQAKKLFKENPTALLN